MIKVNDDIILNENDIFQIEKIGGDSIVIYTNKNIATDMERFMSCDTTTEGYRKIIISFKNLSERDKWYDYIEIQLIKLGKMIEF